MAKKYFYICDKKCECANRADGKKNEYCGYECKHTSDESHALYSKKDHVFVELNNDMCFEKERDQDGKVIWNKKGE